MRRRPKSQMIQRLQGPIVCGIQGAHMLSMLGSWRRFRAAAASPRRAQLLRLKQLQEALGETAYGQASGLRRVQSLEDFQSKVPIVDYAGLAPWVDRIAMGEANILTREPVLMFERSSGSTVGNKWIPYTKRLRAEFSAASAPWLFDMQRRWPTLWGGRSYWSLSPVARPREQTPGGIPVGFEDDSEYFGPLERWALRRCMAVSGEVAKAPDMATWQRETALQLLRAQDLRLISVWSPTFLIQLFKGIEADLPALLRALPQALSATIDARLQSSGELRGEALWPQLSLISCWADGPSAAFLPALRARFPQTPIEPKGLLATEGIVSFPMGGGLGGVIAVNSHFLEFIDLNAPSKPPKLVDQLQVGGHYSPLLTTGGGLVRYALGDIIEVLPKCYRKTPRVRFIARRDSGSDLCGEKLEEAVVGAAIRETGEALGIAPHFAMLAPIQGETPATADTLGYILFIDAEADAERLDAFAAGVESRLMQQYHYKYSRDLGQLAGVQARRVAEGWSIYENRLREEGVRAGDIKPRWLDSRAQWRTWFHEGEGL